MHRLLAPPLAPGCPWSGFTPPNVNWCEEELCSLIVNPADTWSNLVYVVLGLFMWYVARRAGRSDLRLFGPASIAVGVFSFAYHASYTWLLQFFDFVAMFLFCFTVIARNASRLGWIEPRREGRFFALGVAASSALVPPLFELGVAIQLSVALCIAVALGQEAWLAPAFAVRTLEATETDAHALRAAAAAGEIVLLVGALPAALAVEPARRLAVPVPDRGAPLGSLREDVWSAL